MAKRFSRSELRRALRLYGVTDRMWLRDRTLEQCVKQALAGGMSALQLREKDAPREEVLPLALDLQRICAEAAVPFIINDDIELALKISADGVHLGQGDMDCAEARSILGEGFIIGISAQTEEQAVLAVEEGADYLGVGALVPTGTKPDAVDVSKEELEAICAAVDIPVVGIGGISIDNIADFAGCGLDGIAVVSALFAADDCRTAAQELREAVDRELL